MNAAGGIKPSTAAPADLAEDRIHFLDPRNAIEGNPGIEETLEVELMRVLAQEKNVLAHDEPPDRVIDRGVFVVTLIDGELEKMFRKRGHGLVVYGNGIWLHKQWPHRRTQLKI
jgi:hypothetical protein